ncbi:MAG: sugar phosphate isomerase/epimerase family protein [Candidatus Peribacteraceae bacterium]
MPRIQTSCGTWPFLFPPNPPRSFGEVVHRIKELGFDALELGAFMSPHPHPGMDDEQNWPRLVGPWENIGLACSGVAIGFDGAKLITDPDPAAYMAAFERNLRFCTAMKAPLMRLDTTEPPNVLGSIHGEKDAPKTVDPKRAIERVVKVWTRCAKMAADAGIRLAWEPEPGFAINKPGQIIEVCAGVTHPAFGVMLDTCHAHCMAAEGARQPGERETLIGGAVALIAVLSGKINHVHLIDSNGKLHGNETSEHPPFGEGVLDFGVIMPILVKACCPEVNTWTVDLCFWPTAWEALEGCKTYLNGLVARYGQ